ncbi:MAG: hypothetical protein ACTSVU_06485 [Promethearchaeota archaeon]
MIDIEIIKLTLLKAVESKNPELSQILSECTFEKISPQNNAGFQIIFPANQWSYFDGANSHKRKKLIGDKINFV